MSAIHETGGNLHYTMFYFGNEDPLPTRNNLDYARPITWFSRYNDYKLIKLMQFIHLFSYSERVISLWQEVPLMA